MQSGSKIVIIRSGTSKPVSRVLTAEEFSLEMLKAHNDVRNAAELSPLEWSGELAAYSQNWANSLLADDRTAHNSNSPYGENIFTTAPGSTPAEVVAEWASESRNYTYATNNCRGSCGHYTQIVWGSTRKVGCAVARSQRREVWVCSYDPAGNILGQWPY